MTEEQSIKCIGFIMDGNRRWAKARGLSSIEGHRAGYEALKRVIDAVYDAHIPHMVCYAFSTENWKRPQEEVYALMGLFRIGINDIRNSIDHRHTLAVRFIGDRSRLDADMRGLMEAMEREAPREPKLTLWIALSYGGRAEIVDAVNRAVHAGGQVTESAFETLLSTAGMPDPDLIIRTSGEQRISNFLLWQSAYSEFFFVDTLWPDFGERDLRGILEEYGKRERRRGG